MNSEEFTFIKTLKEGGYEGHLDPAVFKSVPRHLMKWLSENINSSVLLKPDELKRLEDLEKENSLMSGSSEVDSNSFACRTLSSDSSVSLSETDDSDVLSNQGISEDVYEDDSDDDDDEEIRALKKEIRAEDERNLMLRQLKDSLMKKLAEVSEETRIEKQKKDQMTQELMESSDKLCALYKDMGYTFQRLVQQAQQVSSVLGSGDCAEKKFVHQVIGDTLEENFQKFLKNVETFVGQQNHEVLVPISEGERFLLDSAPTESKMDFLEVQRVNVMTEELLEIMPRIADLHKRQLAAECAAFELPVAEKLLTSIQTGKYNVTLEQLKSKMEELRREVAKLEAEVEELSESASQAVQQQAQAEVLPVLLSSAKELVQNFSVKQQARERFRMCMESYLCTLILLRSILSCQSDAICHLASFISETHQYVTSKHSQALLRMDMMNKLQKDHNDEQEQAVTNNILLKTFKRLLLGEEDLCNATVDSVFDLMSTSLSHLKVQNTQALEEHCSTLVKKNIAVVEENKKEVEALSEYLLPDDSCVGLPSVYNFNEQFAIGETAVKNFAKKKEIFKNNYDAKKDKINQNSQLRKELLEWVKFITHGKHIQDESFLESASSERSVYEAAGK